MDINKIRRSLFKKIDSILKDEISNLDHNSEIFKFLKMDKEEVFQLRSLVEMHNFLLFGELLYSRISEMSDSEVKNYYCNK